MTFFRKIQRPLFAAMALLAFLPVGVLKAQEVPEDELVLAFSNCMTGCSEFEGRFGCEVLCGCTVERFKVELKEEEYLALLDQMNTDTVTPENRAFLDETAFLCVAEMDNLKEQYGIEDPPEPGFLPPPEDDDEDGEG